MRRRLMLFLPRKKENTIPNNEIHYTSSDGDIITLGNMSGFDANIIEHSYIEGKGILTFDAPVTLIGEQAFNECTSLTSITIPNSVTTIGNNAFNSCLFLNSVYCKPTTPPTGDTGMFTGNAQARKIYVPMISVEAYKSAPVWSNYANYIYGYNF